MSLTASAPEPQPRTPVLFWCVLAASLSAALIPTLLPAMDIASATVFRWDATLVQAENWWWVKLINLYVPAAFRVMLLMALAIWLAACALNRWQAWRLPLAFVVVAGFLGPGAFINGIKDQWQRARPYQVQEFGGKQQFSQAAVLSDQCTVNCSFVSGHVACGFFFASLLLVSRRRYHFTWALTGITAGLTIGFSRMAAHAHWLSDVLWASPLTLLCSWLVWKALLWLRTTRYGARVL